MGNRKIWIPHNFRIFSGEIFSKILRFTDKLIGDSRSKKTIWWCTWISAATAFFHLTHLYWNGSDPKTVNLVHFCVESTVLIFYIFVMFQHTIKHNSAKLNFITDKVNHHDFSWCIWQRSQFIWEVQ